MRKFAAISLLVIFLFNLVGYRFVFDYAQQQSDVQLTSSLDKNEYKDADLITIKVPLSMPYQTMQSDFERVNGEITMNGKIYKYVKRRIVDGEMVLMCLPDNNKMRIQSGKDDFFKNANDIAQNNASKKSDNAKTSVFKNMMGDCDSHITSYSIVSVASPAADKALAQNETLPSSPHTPPVQPPDAI